MPIHMCTLTFWIMFSNPLEKTVFPSVLRHHQLWKPHAYLALPTVEISVQTADDPDPSWNYALHRNAKWVNVKVSLPPWFKMLTASLCWSSAHYWEARRIKFPMFFQSRPDPKANGFPSMWQLSCNSLTSSFQLIGTCSQAANFSCHVHPFESHVGAAVYLFSCFIVKASCCFARDAIQLC